MLVLPLPSRHPRMVHHARCASPAPLPTRRLPGPPGHSACPPPFVPASAHGSPRPMRIVGALVGCAARHRGVAQCAWSRDPGAPRTASTCCRPGTSPRGCGGASSASVESASRPLANAWRGGPRRPPSRGESTATTGWTPARDLEAIFPFMRAGDRDSRLVSSSLPAEGEPPDAPPIPG